MENGLINIIMNFTKSLGKILYYSKYMFLEALILFIPLQRV